MKKLDLRIFTFLLTSTLLVFASQTSAQTAKMQWIHNAAAVALDTVDIYVDGVKIADDLLYTHGSGILTNNAGTLTVNINAATSADSGDQVISRHSLNVVAGSNNLVMITGVDDPMNYAANPGGRDISVKLIHREGIMHSTTSSTTVAVGIYNGITDHAGINLVTRPVSSINLSKMKYGDASGNFLPPNTEMFLDIKDTTGTIVLNSYILPLNLYGKKSISLFTSGFMTPSANQNGAPMAVYLMDTTGGQAIALKAASRIQFINNAPDVILDTVDIWMNATKVYSKLGFRKASATMTFLSGTYDFTVTKKNSPDTTGSNVVFQIKNYAVEGGKNYLALLTGVVDTNNYKTNPDGLNRSLAFNLYNNYAEASNNAGQARLYFAHGIPDAPSFGISRNPTAPITVFPASPFNNIPTSVQLTASSTPMVIMQTIDGEVIQAYRLNLNGQGGKSGVLLTSGFLDTMGNVTGSKTYQYLMVWSDGTSSILSRLEGKLQVVHASADPARKSISLFINGVVQQDTLLFRHATPAITMIAYKPYRVHFCPLGAADTTTAFYSLSLLPDSGKYYYAITSGLSNTAGFSANPEGVDRSFKVILNANGREKALANPKNIDLLYLHNITDMPATTIRGAGQVLFLSKGNKFQDFHGHNAHSAFDDIQFDVRNAYNDTLLFTGNGNFAIHKGSGGLVVSTGFLWPANNSNGDTAMLFVFWPNGKSDTMPSPFTSVKQVAFDAGSVQVFPNPARETFHVSLSMRNATTVHVELTDLTGKSVMSRMVQTNAGKNTFSIETGDIHSGLYLMTIRTGDQQYTSKISVKR